MRFSRLLSLVAASLLASPALAQQPATPATPLAESATADLSRRYAATITAADLEKHLRVLASDAYEGRETGAKGQKMAAEYIARAFAADGLSGPVPGGPQNRFFQRFDLLRTTWQDVTLQLGARKLTYLKDFLPVGTADMPQRLKGQAVFVGFGIEQGDSSDYARADVRGHVAVMWQGEPVNAQGISRFTGTTTRSTWTTDVNRKLVLARQKGAVAVILISERTPKNFTDWIARAAPHLREARVGFPPAATAAATAPLPAMLVSPMVGARLLNTSKGTNANAAPELQRRPWPLLTAPTKLAGRVRLRSRAESTPLPTENVLGYVEGTDKKDELLVLSAHYDHLGIIDGKVYNGADDDGSGTVAVIEMAQAFAQARKDGHGPRRSVLFLAVTGEEKGLLGSEYYTENPVFPLANTVVNLNTDMIGRLDDAHATDQNYIYVIGADKLSSDLHRINEAQNALHLGLKLDYTFNDPADPNRFYYRSDHYNFARKGIPVAFYFNGVHADYHQETDEVDKILFPKMERITRLIFHTAWEIANRDERLRVDSNKP